MKIIKNTSVYDTKKLNTLFCFIHNLIAKDEGRLRRWSILKIHVKKCKFKRGGYSGLATLGVPNYVNEKIPHMTLRINKDLGLCQISQLFAHELMHNYGYVHSQFQSDPLQKDQMSLITEKFIKDELLTPKAFHVAKKGISYKQKCKDLMKEFEWLVIERHPNKWLQEIEVYDERDNCECWQDEDVDCTCDEVFDMRMEWRADNINWKRAYENAMLLILGDIPITKRRVNDETN